jgi:predicted DsbA family dithiol-disulfide isomerase
MARPPITPWSRKAHELALHAREKGRFREVHRALFRAHAVQGRDIGRVDVLVEIAQAEGLEPREAKAVLDVDRFLDRVADLRKEAERLGVRGVPTIRAGERTLEGFHHEASVRNFLSGS